MYNPYRDELNVVDILWDDPQYMPDPVRNYDDPGMVKDPVYIKEEVAPQGGDKGVAIYSGMVIDEESTEKITNANVGLFSNGMLLYNTQTDSTGYFALQDYTGIADTLAISHVGYKTIKIPNGTALITRVFYLGRDVKVIDPVVLPPGGGGGGGIVNDPPVNDGNKKLLMWGGLAALALLAMSSEKKK